MSFLNFKELKDLNDEAMSKEVLDTKKSLFELRLKKLLDSLLNHIYLSTIDVR